MNNSVDNFYLKNPEDNYIDQYEKDHGPRLDAMIQRWDFAKLQNQSILDVGGGLGFLGKRLDKSNTYTVFDGAEIPSDKRLCKGTWSKMDLDRDFFGSLYQNQFNYCFFLETLEHLTNPYNALVEIKKAVKENGEIIISYPTEQVWHNTIYPSLIWPPENFKVFLDQMALPVIETWLWDKGWPAYHWRLRNAPWSEGKMVFPKTEAKFYGKTPQEYTNL